MFGDLHNHSRYSDGSLSVRELMAVAARLGLPVIALTANVSGDSRRRYMQAGFSDFLEKPISISELERVLETYLPNEAQPKIGADAIKRMKEE